MKTKNYLWSLLAMIMVGLLSVGFASCSSDDDDDDPVNPPTPSNTVVVTNSSGSYTFRNFTFIFKNRNDETLSTKECGTIGNNEKASGKLPTGCSYFYFGFYVGNYMVISPNYYVDDTSTRNIKVTYEMVTSWDAYDLSSAPQKISEIR